MTKKIIISILAGSLLFAGAGCKKFLDVNDDPAGAEKVNDGLILTGVEMTTAFSISGGFPARTSTFWTQQLAYNQPAPDWDTYAVTSSEVNNTWAFDVYPAILKNLKDLESQANEAGHKHFEGIAKILIAYNLAVTTDVWNDIPYSEGFQGFGNLTPKYDSQKDIYTTINTLLDNAITLLSGADNSVLPDNKDLIYSGKANKWVSFAYFLKARYALRLCYAPGDANTTTVHAQAALAALAKGFPDEGGNAFVQFANGAGSESPWYQFIQNWGSVVTSKTFIDFLQSKNDPRLPLVAEPSDDGTFVGREIGITSTSPAGTVSEVGAAFTAADMKINLGTYDEQLFIKAEATFLTAGAAAAKPILKQAVEAAMKRFGLDASSAEVQTYITANCNLTPANAYATIMYEKYVANFQTLEAYNDWRRTNLPALTPVANAYLNLKSIPRRWVYPASENATNKQPQQPALLTGRVWWDTK